MMAINKQAAIRTIKILFLVTSSVLLLTFLLSTIPTNWILGILAFLVLGIFIRMIYQACLNDLEWEEKTRQREQIWQKLDEERKNKIK
jgi:uncharacterized membrane protein YfcA